MKRNHENGQAGTSRPAPDEVQAWTVPLTVSADLAGLLFDLLSAGEQIRARRFRLAQDQQRFVATHAALRLILGRCLGIDARDVAFETREGKPGLLVSSGMRFNLSHSGDLAMIAVAWDREVGIDIEQIGDQFEPDGIAQRFFPAHEAAEWQALPAAQRVRTFYQMWVAKEALLKGTGEGLDPVGEPSTRAHDFAVQQLPAPSGYIAAVAVQGQGWHLTCHTFDIAASLKLVYALDLPPRPSGMDTRNQHVSEGHAGRSAFRQLVRWGTKGGLAITDQALISGSNFLIGILLARWLVPEQYGAYALAFAIYLLLLLFYQSLLLEPMSVFGGASYSTRLREYVKSLLWMHGVLALVMCSVLGAATAAAHRFGRVNLQGALAGVTIAAPCVLLFWLARRVFYLGLPLIYAAGASLVYCAVEVAGLLLLYRFNALSPFTAFLLMGLAALATSVVLFVRMWSRLSAGEPLPVHEAWHYHWVYGRWALIGSLAGWIPAYVYYPLLSSSGQIAHAGQLRAIMNFDLPVQQLYAALSLLFLPYAARMQAETGRRGVSKLVRRITLLFTGGALLYWAVLLPLRGQLFHLLYSGKYTELGWLLPFIAIESVLTGALCGPAIVLRAMEAPSAVFWARFAGSVVTLTAGVLATRFFGILGVIIVMIASAVVALLTSFWLLFRRLPQSTSREPGPALTQTAVPAD